MNFEKLIADTDAVTSEFVKYFGSLTEKQLNTKIRDDHWSIAQCMHHVIVVNDSYHALVKSIHQKTFRVGWHSKINLLVDYFGRIIFKAVHPGNEKKIKTPSCWQPHLSSPIDDIVTKFIAHQHQLKSLFLESRELVELRTVIHSPVNSMIVYKLEDAFKIMVAHEQRHLQQAKSLLALQYAEKLNIPNAGKMFK